MAADIGPRAFFIEWIDGAYGHRAGAGSGAFGRGGDAYFRPRFSRGAAPPEKFRVVRVVSALDMEKKVQENIAGARVFVGAAAVSDYRPATMARQKLKDKPAATTLTLLRNPDIIAKVARRGPHRPPVVIGFALETQDVMENASDKLRRKGLDWIVANRVTTMDLWKGLSRSCRVGKNASPSAG